MLLLKDILGLGLVIPNPLTLRNSQSVLMIQHGLFSSVINIARIYITIQLFQHITSLIAIF